jgi:NTE family protein
MKPKLINLALQGGGAHGAFTWGVLDRLLEDDRVEIEGVTGASAGAMNAVALADGLASGCKRDARERLTAFWNGVGAASLTSPLRPTPLDTWRGVWNLDSSPTYMWLDMMSRLASPYDFNPLKLNPLLDMVSRLVDFDRVRSSPVKLFISATNVETGRPKIFEKAEITPTHVMASACLPHMYQAVEIDGVPYWDGGYMGNPPLWPLFDHCDSDDVVIVEINPIHAKGAPTTARGILNRLNEITFNASLMRELRAIDFVSRLIADGRMDGTGYRRVLVHAIADEATLGALGASSKLNAEPRFLSFLFEKGRGAADRWLNASLKDVGVRSSLDLRALFDGDDDPLDGARINRMAAFQDRRPT